MKIQTIPSTLCFHCGLPCSDLSVSQDDRAFCCTGCRAVFEILRENSLGEYYNLTAHPGKPGELSARAYDFLDEPEIKERMVSFAGGNTAKITLEIPDIHCISCIYLLENLYRIHRGIGSSQVNFMKKQLTITYEEGSTSLGKIVALLADLGYKPRLNLDRAMEGIHESEPPSPLIPLGVAGFCFANVMLFSFPAYLGGQEVSPNFRIFFGYLSLLLSIPALFYAGWSWLRGGWIALKHGFLNMDVPIALGLLTLFLRSSFEVISQTGSGYFDSLCGFIFFLLLGRFFQTKTFDHLSFHRDHTAYLPLAIQRLEKEGREIKTVFVEKLEPGDVIFVRNGEVIPADSLLLSERAVLDYSFITGESRAVTNKSGDSLSAGGRVLGGRAKMRVEKKLSSGFFGELWNGPKSKTESPSITHRFSPYFTLSTLIIALLSGLYWSFRGDLSTGLYAFSSVLIVACPCALALSAPFTYGGVIRLLAKRGIFLKDGAVLEKLASLDTVVFDKTGTLTEPGVGLEPLWEDLTSDEKSWISILAHQSIHPVSQGLSRLWSEDELVADGEEFQEIPGQGVMGTVNGRKISFGKMDWMAQKISQPEILAPWKEKNPGLVLAIDGQLKGIYEILSVFRKSWRETLLALAQSYALHLISGDTPKDRPLLEGAFSHPQNIHFGLTPPEKAAYIEDLERRDRKIAMVGDGLNDGGALARSQVGLVLVEDTSHFSPACDAILLGENFSLIPRVLALSKSAQRIIRWSFGLSVLYNLIGLSFAVSGTLSPLIAAILMPLSSVSVMIFTTLGAYGACRYWGLNTRLNR